MSTRCDFYQGRGLSARYLGSIGRDAGLPEFVEHFAGVTTWEDFQSKLAEVFSERGEISAKKGWPWPWPDSHTTDGAIAFDEGQVWATHPTGYWALLQDLDTPSSTRCEFPNMKETYEQSAKGRIAYSLRHKADSVVGPAEDVVAYLVVSILHLLSAQMMHVFQKDGSYWVPARYWNEYSPMLRELVAIEQVLKKHAQDLQEALDQPTGARHPAFTSLLEWVSGVSANVKHTPVELMLDASQPFLLGRALPESQWKGRTHPIMFLKFSNTEKIEQVLALLSTGYSYVPQVFAVAISAVLQSHSISPTPRGERAIWIDTPLPELGGSTPSELALTAEGRDCLKEYAFRAVFES